MAVTKPEMITMYAAMRTCLGMNLRRREMSRFESTNTAAAESPMPTPFFMDVVVASVGHVPSNCTKIGFWSNNPSKNRALRVGFSFFIPLIVVNCIILARAEAYASKNPPVDSMLDGLFMGLGFTFALGLLGGIREFIGNGTLWDVKVTPAAYPGISFFTQPAGAFITLGTLIAAVTAIKTFAAKRKGADK